MFFASEEWVAHLVGRLNVYQWITFANNILCHLDSMFATFPARAVIWTRLSSCVLTFSQSKRFFSFNLTHDTLIVAEKLFEIMFRLWFSIKVQRISALWEWKLEQNSKAKINQNLNQVWVTNKFPVEFDELSHDSMANIENRQRTVAAIVQRYQHAHVNMPNANQYSG